jgi:hypothetical protein
LVKSFTAKLSPVAVPASPAVGDQTTETLDGVPELLEVIEDIVGGSRIQAEFAIVNVGSVAALFEPPMV